jgi:hypothetical protein
MLPVVYDIVALSGIGIGRVEAENPGIPSTISENPRDNTKLIRVASWPIVRLHNSKWAESKVERPEESAAEFRPFLYRKGRKGLNFLKVFMISSCYSLKF